MSTPNPSVLDNAQFVEAAMQGFRDMNLSEEETDRWTKAFKDPEFKELFNDYLEEISDPDARAETDAYLAQIERESKTGEIYGSDVELVVPEVAWCIEAREKSSKNGCYINVCTSPKVPPAKAGPKGAWEIPLNLGPMREEEGATGRVTVHDFVIHPDTRHLSLRNAAFKRMVELSAVEQVEKARDLELERKWHDHSSTYRGVKGYDKPSVLAVKKSGSSSAPGSSSGPTSGRVPPKMPRVDGERPFPAPAEAPTGGLVQELSPREAEAARQGQQEGQQRGAGFDFGRAVAGSRKDAPKKEGEPGFVYPSGETVPEFSVSHVGRADMPDAWGDSRILADHTRPAELKVRVALPGVAGAGAVDLDVSERTVSVVVPGKFKLEHVLPFPVDDAKGRAKFDKGRSELTIVLPVQKPAMQPARAGAPQAGAPGQEEGEKAEAEEVGGEADAPGADRASGGGMSGSSGGNEAEERVAGEPLSADGEELAKGESDGGESKDRSGEGRRDVEAPVETENQRRWRELHAPRAPTDKVGQEGETSAGEDAERRGAEAGEAPSARAEVPAFVPCGGYDGPREGMAFKMGPRGLGYYRDAGPWAAVQSQGEGERGVEPKARRAVVRPRIEVSAIDELD